MQTKEELPTKADVENHTDLILHKQENLLSDVLISIFYVFKQGCQRSCPSSSQPRKEENISRSSAQYDLVARTRVLPENLSFNP
jgi:hypothetical protein